MSFVKEGHCSLALNVKAYKPIALIAVAERNI